MSPPDVEKFQKKNVDNGTGHALNAGTSPASMHTRRQTLAVCGGLPIRAGQTFDRPKRKTPAPEPRRQLVTLRRLNLMRLTHLLTTYRPPGGADSCFKRHNRSRADYVTSVADCLKSSSLIVPTLVNCHRNPESNIRLPASFESVSTRWHFKPTAQVLDFVLKLAHSFSQYKLSPRPVTTVAFWFILSTTIMLFLNFAASGRSQSATDFELEGIVSYDLFQAQEVMLRYTNEFFVAVRDARFLINIRPMGSSNYVECAWDGNVLRTVVADFAIDKTSAPTWRNAAYVEKAIIPRPEFPTLAAVWMAYCSGPYLLAATNEMLEPLWMQDNPHLRALGFRIPAKWLLADTMPPVPLHVVYLSDGIYRGYDPRKKEPFQIPLPPPYRLAFTNAIYRVVSLTNLNAITLPFTFVLRTFCVPLNPNFPPDLPRDTIVGQTTALRTSSSIHTFLPRFHGNASVYDYSITPQSLNKSEPTNYAFYIATAGRWPAGEELETLIYVFTREPSASPKKQLNPMRPQRQRAFIARSVLFVTFCLPWMFVFSRMLLQARKH